MDTSYSLRALLHGTSRDTIYNIYACGCKVLARVSYLLQSGAAPAAADSLLAILSAAALGCTDMARAVCDAPGVVRAPPTFHIVPDVLPQL